jgi:hypothetical protein
MNADNITKHDRIFSIDQFRGFLLFFNALGYMLVAFKAIPNAMPTLNETLTRDIFPNARFEDLFLPMFIFIMGLTACDAFRKSTEKYGQTAALKKTAFKYIVLMGFGSVTLDGVAYLYDWLSESGGDILSFGEIKHSEQTMIILLGALLLFAAVYFIARLAKMRKVRRVAGMFVKGVWAVGGAATLFFLFSSSGSALAARKIDLIFDVFQTIALAGLLALPFMGLNKWGKLTAALIYAAALTVFYQYAGLGAPGTGLVYADKVGTLLYNGGLAGGFGWAICVLLGGYFKDIKDKPILYWVSCAVTIILPIVLSYRFGILALRRGATPVFTIFASGLGAGIWGILNLIGKIYKPKNDFFAIWGGSSILTYALSIVTATLIGAFAADVPLWLAVGIAAAVLIGLSLMNFAFHKKGVHIKI